MPKSENPYSLIVLTAVLGIFIIAATAYLANKGEIDDSKKARRLIEEINKEISSLETYGQISYVRAILPKSYTHICLIDTTKVSPDSAIELGLASLKEGYLKERSHNIFLLKDNAIKNSAWIGHLTLSHDSAYRCYSALPGLEFRLENSGPKTIIISQAELSCGDKMLDPGEECDDGNTIEGDGCSKNCISEK